jgi:hypothetical protein
MGRTAGMRRFVSLNIKNGGYVTILRVSRAVFASATLLQSTA